MVDAARARRLAVRIRQIVATTLEHSVKDPRVAAITITDCRVTADLRDATLFYTVFGDDTASTDAEAALVKARGQLRTEVGKQTGVRYTPSLTVIADIVPEVARTMEELLAAARAADAEKALLAADAKPAGDADPYRVPRELVTDEDDDEPEDDVAPDENAVRSTWQEQDPR